MPGVRRQVVADLCPICGAAGLELCAEEDGQYVLDHWGRPAEVARGIDGVALTNVEALAVVA